LCFARSRGRHPRCPVSRSADPLDDVAALEALDPRTPLIVGAGVAVQQLDEPESGLEALELMIAAARTAAADSGAPGIPRAVQRVAVPHGSWQYTDPGRTREELIGTTVGIDDIRFEA
jgi:hypothetical protein